MRSAVCGRAYSLRCASSSSRMSIRSDGDGSYVLASDIGSLNYAGSYRIILEIVLPCVAASSVSFAPPFPAEFTHSAAPPFPRESPFARMRRGIRRSLRSLSTIASEFPSVALLVFSFVQFSMCSRRCRLRCISSSSRTSVRSDGDEGYETPGGLKWTRTTDLTIISRVL